MNRHILLLALAITLSGCRTAGKFRSQREEGYEGKLNRVLLVYSDQNSTATLGRDFPRRVVSRLGESLSRQNVSSEAVPFSASALDNDAPVRAAADRFSPSQILYFTLVRINSSSSIVQTGPNDVPQYSHTMVVTLSFSVWDAKTAQTIWRTEADYYSAPRAEDVADAVIDQLRIARLL